MATALLSAGVHTTTLRAVNSAGLTATAQVTVVVRPDSESMSRPFTRKI